MFISSLHPSWDAETFLFSAAWAPLSGELSAKLTERFCIIIARSMGASTSPALRGHLPWKGRLFRKIKNYFI
jgi:hypothetical protein